MPQRRVLHFDGTTLSALQADSAGMAVEADFRPTAGGLVDFEAFLGKHRSSLFYLLVDVADEGFQLETIPHVTGKDRGALIKRRLGQYFYGTPLSVGISLGREKEGRKDERMLFAALTRPDAITVWLEVLQRTRVAMAGVFSTPLVFAQHPPAFIGDRQSCLLITLSAHNMRQTFFEQGQLRFSRVSQVTSLAADEIAFLCDYETKKTYQYLVGQRLIRRGTPLPAVILAHSDASTALNAHCQNTAEIQFELSDIQAAARAAGLKTPPADSNADALIAHQLIAHTPRLQFAPKTERRFYQLWKTGFILQLLAAAVALTAIIFGLQHALRWQELSADSAALTQQTSLARLRYQSLIDSLPKVALSPQDLRVAMGGFDQLQKRSESFDLLLNRLGKALDATPAIEIERLDWMLAPALDAKVGAGHTAMVSAPSAATPPQLATWAIFEIDGRFTTAVLGDQRAMIARLDQFAEALRTQGLTVIIMKRPIDVESGKSYKSVDMTKTSTAQFSLRLGSALPSP